MINHESAPGAMPSAWKDLIDGLTLLSHHVADEVSPLHCEHDQLQVMADATKFTVGEIDQLEAWGFHIDDDEECFYSFRFGSA